MELSAHLDQLLWTIIYAGVGTVILGSAFLVMTRLIPFSVRHEIEEDHNTALAVLMASVILSLAIIIAAAIAG